MKQARRLRRFPEHCVEQSSIGPFTQREERKAPQIALGTPRPFATPGIYHGKCVSATLDWRKRYKKWICILKFDLLDYTGRPFIGELCGFFQLGHDPNRPYAGSGGRFYKLLAEVNGAAPMSLTADLDLFLGRTYEVEVVTVSKGQDGQPMAPESHYSKIDKVRLSRGA